MAIAVQTKKIDYKGRIQIPKQVLASSKIKVGDEVMFDVTKTGSIVLRVVPAKRITKEYDEDGVRHIDIGVEEDGE